MGPGHAPGWEAPQPLVAASGENPASGIDLYWLPLGAGATFGNAVVRFNGRVYEWLVARRERRAPLALYHCALEVTTTDGRYVIELTPVPADDGSRRGVVVHGPVGMRWLGYFRWFRYELRCWLGGTIPDLVFAVASPQRLTDDPDIAARLLANLASVPSLVWGRDEQRTGEMWNSNSVIAWLLDRSGVPLAHAQPPPGGRAPGWHAGLAIAQRPGSLAADRPPRSGRPAVRGPSGVEPGRS